MLPGNDVRMLHGEAGVAPSQRPLAANSPLRVTVEKMLDEDAALFLSSVLEALLYHIGGKLVLAVHQKILLNLTCDDGPKSSKLTY